MTKLNEHPAALLYFAAALFLVLCAVVAYRKMGKEGPDDVVGDPDMGSAGRVLPAEAGDAPGVDTASLEPDAPVHADAWAGEADRVAEDDPDLDLWADELHGMREDLAAEPGHWAPYVPERLAYLYEPDAVYWPATELFEAQEWQRIKDERGAWLREMAVA